MDPQTPQAPLSSLNPQLDTPQPLEAQTVAPRPNKNKLLLVGLAGIFIILLFLFLLLRIKMSLSRSITTHKPSPISKIKTAVSITPIPTLAVKTVTNDSTTNLYKDTGFSLLYPKGWVVSAIPQNVSFQEPLATYKESYRGIVVSQSAKSSEALLSVPAYMRNLHMTETDVTFEGMPTQKFSGVQTLRSFGQETTTQPYWDTLLLFSHNDTVFTIEYTYDGSSKNNDQEIFFTRLINSLQIN